MKSLNNAHAPACRTLNTHDPSRLWLSTTDASVRHERPDAGQSKSLGIPIREASPRGKSLSHEGHITFSLSARNMALILDLLSSSL